MTNSAGDIDRITKRRADRKKKRKRNWLIIGVAGAVLLYLLACIISTTRSGLSTTVAQKGSIEEKLLADGYVFRDQRLIDAPASGYLECRVKEGNRVGQDELLGYIYTGVYDSQRSQQIRELSERIARLETSVSAENTYASDTVMVEQKIAEAVRDLSDQRQARDMSGIANRKEDLNILIERKTAMERGGSLDTESMLESMRASLQELETGTNGAKLEIKAAVPGVFSSKIDGLEEKLSLAAAENVSPGYLKSLDSEPLLRNEDVVQGEPVCKIIDNYRWIYAANISKEEAKDLQAGQSVQLRFFDLSDTPVEGKIQRISQEEDGQVAVEISTNRYVDGIYSLSRASAEIITTSVEGIKLPAQSLHMQDGQSGVYVLRLDVARFVPVDVWYRNEDWAVVGAVNETGQEYSLQIYDEVVVEAKNLEDGKVVR